MGSGLSKAWAIITGWYYFLMGDSRGEEKRKICKKCTYRNGFRCGICGCPLGPKTRATGEHCDLGKW